MTGLPARPSRRHRPERFRRIAGSLVEFGIKTYGAAAAVSVAFSEAETVAGKRDDALNPMANLSERYHSAEYLVEHRAEIHTALDYVDEHALEPEELEAAAQESSETLGDIVATYDEASEVWDDFDFGFSTDLGFSEVKEAAANVGKAFSAAPDLESVRSLAGMAENVVPFIEHVDVLIPALYGGALLLVDNFASNEIAGTLLVMGAVYTIAYVFGTAIGFWARRGRPGFMSRTLQSWGARLFQDWYVRHLEFALGRPLYAAARTRIQDDIVADPQGALDTEAFRELERYFQRRLRGDELGSWEESSSRQPVG